VYYETYLFPNIWNMLLELSQKFKWREVAVQISVVEFLGYSNRGSEH